MTITIERGPLAHLAIYSPIVQNFEQLGRTPRALGDLLATAHLAIYLPLRTLIHTLEALCAILATLCGYWRPLALSAALAGAVVLCAACPLLPLGLAITGAFAYVTYPRQGVK